jgi:hypothetical protein
MSDTTLKNLSTGGLRTPGSEYIPMESIYEKDNKFLYSRKEFR